MTITEASSRPITLADEVADRVDAIATTYAGDLPGGGIVVADGFGLRVRVEKGALEVADGVGEHRRTRRYEKVSAPSRLVVVGEGAITTDALAWCSALGVAVVVCTPDRLLLAASPPGRNDPRIRRAQALALGSPAGLAVVRYLLEAKLAGQSHLLRGVLGATAQADTIEVLADGVALASSADDARQTEAVAAALYFGAWDGHPATSLHFVSRDRGRVPEHWCVYDGRRSVISGAGNTNRLAERPLNALLNYVYRLAELEARVAAVRLGLDPGLGVLHLDAPGRDSLALDLMEPIRPIVDHFCLDLVAERAFHKRDFAERDDGHVRVMAPLTHELAAIMPVLAKAIAPHAERVAHIFADEVAGKLTLSTPLTGARAKAASADVRKRKAAVAQAQAEAENSSRLNMRSRRSPAPKDATASATRLATCVDCGGVLTRSRHVRCPACWEHQPAQSRGARRRRGIAIAGARSDLERWKAEHPQAVAHPEEFAAIREGLQGVTLADIMAATGASKTSASGWRSGRTIPNLRHWEALAGLSEVSVPEVAG